MPTTITLRSIKGSALTHNEVDDNFSNLKTTADAALPTASLGANVATALAVNVGSAGAVVVNGAAQTITGPLNRSGFDYLTFTNQYSEPPFVLQGTPGDLSDSGGNHYTNYSFSIGPDPAWLLANSRGGIFVTNESRYQLNNLTGAANTVSEYHVNFNTIAGVNHRPITIYGHWDGSGNSVGLQGDIYLNSTDQTRLVEATKTCPLLIRKNNGDSAFVVDGTTGTTSIAALGTIIGPAGTGVRIGSNLTGTDEIIITSATGPLTITNAVVSNTMVINSTGGRGPLVNMTKSGSFIGAFGTTGAYLGNTNADFIVAANARIAFFTNYGGTEIASFRTDGSLVLGPSGTTTAGAGNIRATTVLAMLNPPAGTATAGTAPLKFTSGTNLTTAEAGAMEYNGTNLFFTRAGTTREGVLTQSAVTTEALASDTSITVNIGGTTYKLLARA